MSDPANENEEDPLLIAREVLKRMSPEERYEVQVEAERLQISEEYVILEVILQIDLTEFANQGSGSGLSGPGERGE